MTDVPVGIAVLYLIVASLLPVWYWLFFVAGRSHVDSTSRVKVSMRRYFQPRTLDATPAE